MTAERTVRPHCCDLTNSLLYTLAFGVDMVGWSLGELVAGTAKNTCNSLVNCNLLRSLLLAELIDREDYAFPSPLTQRFKQFTPSKLACTHAIEVID